MRAGGIVGALREGNIINCHNINTIVEVKKDYAGGIAGQFQGEEIINRTNSASISVENLCIGGIVGLIQGTIKECENTGFIKGNKYVGGIAGFLDSNTEIKKCTNNGTIIAENSSTGYNWAGGIAGALNSNSQIKNCVNNANITTQSSYTGGIVGCVNVSSIIERCSNNGEINGKGYYTGGIVGLLATDSKDPSDVTELNKISYCYNTAKVKSDVNVGGIVGAMAQYGSIVEKCYNIGDIEGTSSIGGIAGSHGRSSKIENSYNIGNVKGETGVGGITGKSYGSAGSITNSYNIGKVQGSTEIGGIIGGNPNSLIITNAYYLTGTADKDQGNLGGTELAKDKEYISTIFLTTSNESENIWKVDENKNNGYPILVELEPSN